jgi:hypothetical protein
MPNPVAVNDLQPISGSLQTSRISYAVETAGKNYGQDYNNTTWYSDIPQNGSQYTIITDNYTANYYVSRSNAEGAYVEGGLPAVDEYSAPVFWLTAGTSSLDIITIVNGLPDRRGQIPFNSGSQALNWIASSSNYFAVGPPYEQIDADQLVYYIDGSQIISYPTTGSSWYDLSGQFNNTILYNGPTFNSNGWLDFDGSDDYGLVSRTPSISPTSGITQEALINWDADDGVIIGLQYGNSSGNSYALWRDGGAWKGLVQTSGGTQVIQYSQTLTTGKWFHFLHTYSGSTQYLYLNGTQIASSGVSGGNLIYDSNNNVVVIGGDFNSGYNSGLSLAFNGKIAKTRIYGKGLSESEILQNYYQGPVVTGSISGSYYANNLVSYASGSTATYNLSANIISGSLQNGVAFSPLNGGYWSFDGTDDYILLEGSTTSAWILNSGDTWTVNSWIRVPSGSFGSAVNGGYYYGPIFSNTDGGPIYAAFQVNGGTIAYTHYNGGWLTKYGTVTVNDGKWHLLTWVNSSNSMTFYVDGVADGTVNSTISGTNWLDAIGRGTGGFYQGDIASLQINKGKAFTAAEVLQQYNATK